MNRGDRVVVREVPPSGSNAFDLEVGMTGTVEGRFTGTRGRTLVDFCLDEGGQRVCTNEKNLGLLPAGGA